MIVATAGHVDHGKTSLVRALTGIDTDRLPEEKRRGLTIDLGFAYLPSAQAGTIGFVDVPGHERFVHNMLAGVGGIDVAMLIVAADDGPMPQTREHLAILDLLGVPRGVVALTKIDRVAAERIEEVEAEIIELLEGTTLAGSPIFKVAAPSNVGVDALVAHLHALARDLLPRTPRGNFRLAVDRAFTVAGAGLVVTGTVVAGRVAVGETVRAQLAGVTARIRSLHAQNAKAEVGQVGERCALNLTSTERGLDQVARGDWVVGAGAPEPAARIDIRLRILKSEARALAHWTPVHVHLGANDVTGRVALLEAKSIAPGANGLAQLVLDRPLAGAFGDRLIIRDQSARRTIGGGYVLDMLAPGRGRAKPERLLYLRAIDQIDSSEALRAALALGGAPVDREKFARNRNLTVAEVTQLTVTVPVVVAAPLAPPPPEPPRDEAWWKPIRAAMEAAGDRPPSPGELAKQLGMNLTKLQGDLERASKQGLLRRVAPGRYFLAASLD
ncbi:MAG: selenocysteine-specific translation elongation factor, partial [Burkholderiales bacterium]